jgi:hypothetical protein
LNQQGLYWFFNYYYLEIYMKKYLIALLFGMSFMSMQTASAASLSLSQAFGIGSVTTASGSTVSGTGNGTTIWDVTVSGLGAGGTADLSLTSTITGPVSFFSSGFLNTSGIGIGDGVYKLLVLLDPSTSSFSFDVSIGNVTTVPVPAALWLFGSAIAGLIGVTRRKSQPALAA